MTVSQTLKYGIYPSHLYFRTKLSYLGHFKVWFTSAALHHGPLTPGSQSEVDGWTDIALIINTMYCKRVWAVLYTDLHRTILYDNCFEQPFSLAKETLCKKNCCWYTNDQFFVGVLEQATHTAVTYCTKWHKQGISYSLKSTHTDQYSRCCWLYHVQKADFFFSCSWIGGRHFIWRLGYSGWAVSLSRTLSRHRPLVNEHIHDQTESGISNMIVISVCTNAFHIPQNSTFHGVTCEQLFELPSDCHQFRLNWQSHKSRKNPL